jgi:hypothetical protein
MAFAALPSLLRLRAITKRASPLVRDCPQSKSKVVVVSVIAGNENLGTANP